MPKCPNGFLPFLAPICLTTVKRERAELGWQCQLGGPHPSSANQQPPRISPSSQDAARLPNSARLHHPKALGPARLWMCPTTALGGCPWLGTRGPNSRLEAGRTKPALVDCWSRLEAVGPAWASLLLLTGGARRSHSPSLCACCYLTHWSSKSDEVANASFWCSWWLSGCMPRAQQQFMKPTTNPTQKEIFL